MLSCSSKNLEKITSRLSKKFVAEQEATGAEGSLEGGSQTIKG